MMTLYFDKHTINGVDIFARDTAGRALISEETANRVAADAALSEDLTQKITAEQTAREAADATLSEDLASEIAERKSLIVANGAGGASFPKDGTFGGNVDIGTALNVYGKTNLKKDTVIDGALSANDGVSISGMLKYGVVNTGVYFNKTNFIGVDNVSYNFLVDNDSDTKISNSILNDTSGKRICIYGDSWVDSNLPYHVFCDYIGDLLNAGDLHYNGLSGAPLSSYADSVLDGYVADIYIIEGGINDADQNHTSLQTRDSIYTIATKLRSYNPNAQIYFTTVPYPIETSVESSSGAIRYYPMEVYRQAVWVGSICSHCYTIDGLKLPKKLNLTSEGYHPASDSDYQTLAQWIANSVKHYGDCRNYQTIIREIANEAYLYVYNGNVRYIFTGALTYTNGVANYPTWYKDDVSYAPRVPCNTISPSGGLKSAYASLDGNGFSIDFVDTSINGTVATSFAIPNCDFLPSGYAFFSL